MPNYDVNIRRDWFLPLVGGAELNRIKGPTPIIFTSRPYFVDVEDSVTTEPGLRDSFIPFFLDYINLGNPQITGGSLRTTFQEYKGWPMEPVTTTLTSVLSGTLATAFKSYTNWPREEMQTSLTRVSAGTLKAALIGYTRWATEEVKTTLTTITAGTLT